MEDDVISTDNSLKNLDNKDSAYAGNFQRTPDESSTEEEEDSFDGASPDCVGICNVPDAQDEHSYPAWKKYYEAMAKGLELETLADAANEQLKAEREARERRLSGGKGGSSSEGALCRGFRIAPPVLSAVLPEWLKSL